MSSRLPQLPEPDSASTAEGSFLNGFLMAWAIAIASYVLAIPFVLALIEALDSFGGGEGIAAIVLSPLLGAAIAFLYAHHHKRQRTATGLAIGTLTAIAAFLLLGYWAASGIRVIG